MFGYLRQHPLLLPSIAVAAAVVAVILHPGSVSSYVAVAIAGTWFVLAFARDRD